MAIHPNVLDDPAVYNWLAGDPEILVEPGSLVDPMTIFEEKPPQDDGLVLVHMGVHSYGLPMSRNEYLARELAARLPGPPQLVLVDVLRDFPELFAAAKSEVEEPTREFTAEEVATAVEVQPQQNPETIRSIARVLIVAHIAKVWQQKHNATPSVKDIRQVVAIHDNKLRAEGSRHESLLRDEKFTDWVTQFSHYLWRGRDFIAETEEYKSDPAAYQALLESPYFVEYIAKHNAAGLLEEGH